MSPILDRLEPIKKLLSRPIYSVILFILLGLFVGFLLSIVFLGQPQLGVISVSGIILDQRTTSDIVKMLSYAEDNSRIKAVVVVIDSPGGEAAAIEEVYLNMLALKKKKPIVASIARRALSGGYYIASATNFIYCKPTSQVGGVGVWVSLPETEELEEDVMPTGPFKSTGGSVRQWVGYLDMVKQAFVQAVTSQRGDRLRIDAYELSEARVYIGMEAAKLGIVDKIGTTKDAERKAADLAHVRHYQVVDINRKLNIQPSLWSTFLSETTAEAEMGKLPRGLSPVYYYLYVEQR